MEIDSSVFWETLREHADGNREFQVIWRVLQGVCLVGSSECSLCSNVGIDHWREREDDDGMYWNGSSTTRTSVLCMLHIDTSSKVKQNGRLKE